MQIINKKYVISILIGLAIIICIFFVFKNIQIKNVELDIVKIIDSDLDSSMFAIMIEQSDGTYKESVDKVWPTIGYDYDEEKSGCVDELGNTIYGILTYDVVNRLARVKTNKAATCFLYFELLKKDLNVNISSENGSASLIGKYKQSVYCENAEATYNDKYDRIEFTNLTYPGNCTLFIENDENTYPTLISKIEETKTKTDINTGICSDETYTTKADCEGAGASWWGVFEENGLRYEGLHPDNYVWFNNEMWRIIGYLPTKDVEGNDINLVKIIRAESIGGIAYNTTATSVFAGSNLDHLLNDYYYNSFDGTNSGYCYGYSNTITIQCDYRNNGLNEQARSMVVPVQWAIGTYGTSAIAGTQYTNEIKTWTAVENGINIGIMNPSDYLYGPLTVNCNHASVKSEAYNTVKCAGSNWLYGSTGYVLGIYSSSAVRTINNSGALDNKSPIYSYEIRPVLYLNLNIYVKSGDGSITNPYQIAM